MVWTRRWQRTIASILPAIVGLFRATGGSSMMRNVDLVAKELVGLDVSRIRATQPALSSDMQPHSFAVWTLSVEAVTVAACYTSSS